MLLWARLSRTERRLVIGLACSVLLHLVLVAVALVFPGFSPPATYWKRGEPLLVDIAPERPDEAAPRGHPNEVPGAPRRIAAPVAPTPPPPPKPSVSKPSIRKAPAPKIAARPAPEPKPAPTPAAPKPPDPPKAPEPPKPPEPARAPAQPEPAKEIVRVVPPEVQAPASRQAEPRPPAPRLATPAPSSREPEPSSPGKSAPSEGGMPAGPSESRLALAKPRLDLPPEMFRRGGGGGLRDGRGGVEGEPVPLDTPEPKYQDYFNQIRERIRRNWGYPREAAEREIEGQLLVEFRIAKSGRLEFLELRRSSGYAVLDDYALNAVRLADPFPPVPDSLAKTVLVISGTFRYQIVIGTSLLNQIIR